MATCFVIQPFDKDTFDKRYEDVFEPAIRAAGFEPYRVDRDPSASIPIEEIETGIGNAQVCFAEITTDNPNVWFELGFAIASRKPVCLVCSTERQSKFPFDVQHRKIIPYDVRSKSDFEELGKKITERLKAIVAKQEQLESVARASPIQPTEGLSAHEMVALTLVFQSDGGIAPYQLGQEMENAGFTKLAASLAAAQLHRKGFIVEGTATTYEGDDYRVYQPSSHGIDWLLANQDRLVLRRNSGQGQQITDQDIPF